MSDRRCPDIYLYLPVPRELTIIVILTFLNIYPYAPAHANIVNSRYDKSVP